MKQYALATALLAACSLAACDQNDGDKAGAATGKPAPTGMMAEAARQAEAKAKIAALPKADLARPLSDYAKLDGGEHLMFLYLAAARLPPDYPAIASDFSSDYRQTSDSFRKQDLLTALKPQIQARIDEAKQQPYAWMEVDDSDNLAGYDFQRGGFPVQEFQEETTRYFNDASAYRLKWANREALVFAPVKDEAVAREIEAMRNDYNNKPRLKVYFFAQAVDLDNKFVKADVTAVQITDRNGRVLAEYGPAVVGASTASRGVAPATSAQGLANGSNDAEASTAPAAAGKTGVDEMASGHDCGTNGTVVFSCITTKGKFVQTCTTGREATYSFGRPAAKPELFLRRAHRDVRYSTNVGMKGTDLMLTFTNGGTSYRVRSGYWSGGWGENGEFIDVAAGGRLKATLECKDEAVVNFEALPGKPEEYSDADAWI